MENKIKYDKYDAGYAFSWAIISPQIVAFIFAFIISMISIVSGVEYQSLIENYIIVAISILISPIAFGLSFYKSNKRAATNWKKAIGLDFKLNWVNVLLCMLISLICVFGFNELVNLFDGIISLTGFKGNYAMPLPLDNAGWLILNLFLMAVLPAIFEEILFRGVIFNGLKQYGSKIAVLGSAALFMLMHGGIEQTVYPFLVGLVLALVMLKTSNILYPIIIHFCNNATVIVYNFILTVQNAEFGDVYHFEAVKVILAFVYAVAAAVAIWAIVRYLIKANNKNVKLTDFGTEVQSETKEQEYPNRVLWFGVAIGVVFWIIDLIVGFGA